MSDAETEVAPAADTLLVGSRQGHGVLRRYGLLGSKKKRDREILIVI
jgi:hypothetical protein